MEGLRKWKVGDQIHHADKNGQPVVGDDGAPIIREITKVRKHGYDWKYPDLGDLTPSGEINCFRSENSNDPELFWWRLWEGERVVPRRRIC
jgi:hypothetical protein